MRIPLVLDPFKDPLTTSDEWIRERTGSYPLSSPVFVCFLVSGTVRGSLQELLGAGLWTTAGPACVAAVCERMMALARDE